MDLRSKRMKLSVPSEVPSPRVEPQFPPEVWEMIFDKLFVNHLLQVRLTCRRWKEIVDGSSMLKDRIMVWIPPQTTLDKNYKKDSWFPAQHAFLYYVNIIDPPTQCWPSFAASIESLEITDCNSIPFRTFLWMLQYTTNLKRLILSGICFEGSAVTMAKRFQLHKMERLEIECVSKIEMATFAMIFPRLKYLDIEDIMFEWQLYWVVDYIRSVQHCLEGIGLNSPALETAQALSKLDRLRLKKVAFRETSFQSEVIDFLQMQPGLEDVTLDLQNLSFGDLKDVGRLLPQLKRLKICITEDRQIAVPSFLLTMIALEEFECSITDQTVVGFHGICSPNLKKLKMVYSTISLDGLYQYLRNSRNIHTLSLYHCNVSNWFELFIRIGQVPHLRHLHLDGIYVDEGSNVRDDNHDSNGSSKLWSLSLKAFRMSTQDLLTLLQQHPNLVELRLSDIQVVNEEVFLLMCQRLQCLRALTIFDCPEISENAVRRIIKEYYSEELLTVEVVPVIDWGFYQKAGIRVQICPKQTLK